VNEVWRFTCIITFAMLLSLALLLLLCQGTGHLYGHGHSSRDMLALLDFKKAISGNKPNRALSSWNTSTPSASGRESYARRSTQGVSSSYTFTTKACRGLFPRTSET